MGTVLGGALSIPTISSADPVSALARRSIFLVFCCTILGAGAQVLIKSGANTLTHPSLWQMITNTSLILGYGLYGVSTMLLVVALRHGQLSILYPVIALTYVWVSILSVAVFHERMNAFKVAGIATVVLGVAVLGLGDNHE